MAQAEPESDVRPELPHRRDVTGGLIAHNTNSTITVGVPPDPGAGALLLDALPLMGLDGNQMLRQDIAELRAEIEKPGVESVRTAPLLTRINTRLVDLGVNTSGGVLASMFLLGIQHYFRLPPA